MTKYSITKCRISKIDMAIYNEELSNSAFSLLNVLYMAKAKDDLSANSLAAKVGVGLSTYKKVLSELKDYGILSVVQNGRYKYKYILGTNKIAEDKEKYAVKGIIEDTLENFMILELREPTKEELGIWIKEGIDQYNNRKLEEEVAF